MDVTSFAAILGSVIGGSVTLIGAVTVFVEKRNRSRMDAQVRLYDDKMAARDEIIAAHREKIDFVDSQYRELRDVFEAERGLWRDEQETLRSYYEGRLAESVLKLREDHRLEIDELKAAHAEELAEASDLCDRRIRRLQKRVTDLEAAGKE